VLEILSHDSAEISAEVRNLREGVLYGFFFFAGSAFPASASHGFSAEVLSASIDPPMMSTETAVSANITWPLHFSNGRGYRDTVR
jgi:hypothetical protein